VNRFYLSDLDKTLLKDDLSISEYTKDIWNTLVKKGVKLSIATARSFTGVKKLLGNLELKEPMILLDGAMIADSDGQILDLKFLKRDFAQEIIEFAKKQINIYPVIVGLEENNQEVFLYPKEKNSFQKELLEKFHNDKRVLDLENFNPARRNLKLVFMDTKKKTAKLEYALKAKFGRSIEIKRNKDPYINCYFLTVLHPKADKSNALRTLERIEGVNKKDTTVFGDSFNDIGLFKMAGEKVAVSNAVEELKVLADIVLPWSNEEDAIARFLEERLLKND
jgi:Cof subfamily protein (haloacid dehalogenase superfamily)